MKKVVTIIVWLCGLIISQISTAQPLNLVLNQSESGTQVHQARKSITFAPGFSYTPNGGSMVTQFVNPVVSGTIAYSSAINPATYSINTTLPVGKTQGSLQVAGSANYVIPLDLPKGSAGLQPAVSLIYSSNFSDGLMGVGWDIGGLSSISRVNNTIYFDNTAKPVKGDINDKYALDGSRLVLVSGTYGVDNSIYGTEMEEFSKIVAHGTTGYGPEYFTVYTKSGLIYEYGNSVDSKVKNGSAILVWKLNKVTDRYNNFIVFTYFEYDDEHPICSIEYTGNSALSVSPFAQVYFRYKNRSDTTTYTYGGKEFTRDILLDSIEIKNNNQSYKKYGLAYTFDSYSQLLKVTEYSSQGATFNPTVFAWTDQTDQFSQSFIDYNSEDEYIYIGDYNGDGKDDMVTVPIKTSYTASDSLKLYLANSSGSLTYTGKNYLNSHFETFLVSDFNGDGLDDLMMQQNEANEQNPYRKHFYYYQLSGNSFIRSSTYYNCPNGNNVGIVDYNGDGILEFFYHSAERYWHLYNYSGGLLFSNLEFTPSFPNKFYVIDFDNENRIIDFNSDGCSDILLLTDSTYEVFEFKGISDLLIKTYWGSTVTTGDDELLFGDFNNDGNTDIMRYNQTPTVNWDLLTLNSNGFSSKEINSLDQFSLFHNQAFSREMDGDGRMDLVFVGRGTNSGNSYNRINVALNNGEGFTITENIASTTFQDLDRVFHFGDFNGDGRDQLWYEILNNSWVYNFATGTPSHLINTVIDGFGAKTTLTYLPMSNSSVYTRGSGATYPVCDFSSSMQLVSQVSYDNGIGGTTNMNYLYEGAKVHLQGKGFIGFTKVTATNAATGIFSENNYTFDGTYFYPKLMTGYTKRGAVTLSTVSNTWTRNTFSDKRVFPYISSSTQTDNLTGLSVTSTASYNSYGNPTSVAKNLGGGHTVTTTYSYSDERVTDWLIGRPTTITETMVKGSDTKTFVTTRTYPTTNNSPDIDQYNSGDGSYWQLNRDYDSFGNLWRERKSATGLSELTTTYTYDSYGVNPILVADPAANETGYSWVAATGLLYMQTDPMGNVTTYAYNTADQVSSVTPDGGISKTVSRSFDVTGGPSYARYYILETGSDGKQAKTWYDKLGREIRSEAKGFGGTMVKVDKQYNSKGQLAQVSEPTTGTPSNWNTITYDDYGRSTSTDPYYGPTSTFSYSGATATKTVNSRNYGSTVNAAGQTTSATDPGGTLSYDYWPTGQLKSVTAPGSVVTNLTYDKNGNRLTIVDPSAGTVTNTWYGTGQPKTVQNARGQTTTYTYQTNGLPDYYTTTAEGQTNISYNTDNLVSSLTTPEGVTRSYTYDTRGRVSTITESVGGVSNTVTYNYDSQSRLYRKYFNGPTDYEQYSYNSNGYLYQISFNGTTVWQLTNMDDYGRTRQAAIGTTTASWTYDGSNQLSQVAANGVQRYDYSFDANTGNLGSRANYLKTLSESFGYDANGLDRLDSVSGPSVQKLAYTSNNNGNILTKSDAGAYSYGGGPYAVSGIASALNIDTARQAIEYYSFEKVKQITEGTKTAEFVYNPGGQRIRMILKTSGTTTKTRWYFGGSCEREEAAGVVTQIIWIGGDAYTAVAVAKKVGTGSWTVYNIFRDHLGTITHLKTGSTITEYSFDAWGRRRDKDNWSYNLSGEPDLFASRGFTAHEYLEDFKLYNMNGRLYDPVVGRFLSPDPYIQDAGFTQGYNRYSYVLNNPLKYIDPTGNVKVPKPEPDIIVNPDWLKYADGCMDWAMGGQLGGGGDFGYGSYLDQRVEQMRNRYFWNELLSSVNQLPDGEFAGVGYRLNEKNQYEFLFRNNIRCTDGTVAGIDDLLATSSGIGLVAGSPWIDIAFKEYYTGVAEMPEDDHNPRIIEYLKKAGLAGDYLKDETGWCAAFVNWCLGQVDINGAGARPANYNTWGQSIIGPAYGAIAIFNYSHVGFVVGENGNDLKILHGNYSNRISLSNIKASEIQSYVYPTGYMYKLY